MDIRRELFAAILPEFERKLAIVRREARRYFPKQGPPGDHAGVERQSMRVAINLQESKSWPTTTQPAHAEATGGCECVDAHDAPR